MSRDDILAQILIKKAERLEAAKRSTPLVELGRQWAESPRSDFRSLRSALERDAVNVIAELKRASPSKGPIRPDLDSTETGVALARAGAAAISVLTEEDYFRGSLEALRTLRPRVDIPLLRKDFLFDEYQLLEAALAGADAVLLIAAALEQSKLRDLSSRARELGLESLVEVHNAFEMEIVLDCGCDLVGVNNRSLKTFEVDLGISRELATHAPQSVVLVCESGIEDRSTIDEMRSLGYSGFLIGEHLMRGADPAQSLENLLR